MWEVRGRWASLKAMGVGVGVGVGLVGGVDGSEGDTCGKEEERSACVNIQVNEAQCA